MSAGATRRTSATNRNRAGGRPPTPRITLNAGHQTLYFAQKAIDALMEHGGFIADSKAQFALRMGWVKPGVGGVDEPDRRLVEDVCNLTRDLAHDPQAWPEAADLLAGYVIAYAPNSGGMTLIDPDGDQPLHHLTHILLGDLQKQQQIKTINRRRLPSWSAAAQNAFNAGDFDLARLFSQSEDQIKRIGFVEDQTINAIFQVADSRGLLRAG